MKVVFDHISFENILRLLPEDVRKLTALLAEGWKKYGKGDLNEVEISAMEGGSSIRASLPVGDLNGGRCLLVVESRRWEGVADEPTHVAWVEHGSWTHVQHNPTFSRGESPEIAVGKAVSAWKKIQADTLAKFPDFPEA